MGRRAALLGLLSAAACTQRPPAAILSFTVTPASIVEGGSAQLEWKATGASDCVLGPDLGTVPGTGAAGVTPLTTTAYTLTCGAAMASAVLTVNHPVKVDAFSASPARISEGGSVVLSWAAPGSMQSARSSLPSATRTRKKGKRRR